MSALTGDVRSVSHGRTEADDQNIQRMRDQIGTEFTNLAKRADQGKKRNELGKDDFLKLMSTQLKHQDPLSPMKNEQMAAQLAQFSSLEQMLNMNQNIEKLTNAQKPTEHMIAASMIGKKVTTANTHFTLEKGVQPELRFNLPDNAASVKLNVVSAKGEVVREMELGEMKKGAQSIRWDGKNGKSQEQALGQYTFNILASDKEDKNIEVKMDHMGLVTGVAFEGGKSFLIVDGQKVPMETVGKIENEAVPGNQAAVNSVAERAALPPPESKQIKSNPGTVQGAKNNLPPDLSPEKIKAMLASMGLKGEVASTGAEQAEAGASNPPMPLWNPDTQQE